MKYTCCCNVLSLLVLKHQIRNKHKHSKNNLSPTLPIIYTHIVYNDGHKLVVRCFVSQIYIWQGRTWIYYAIRIIHTLTYDFRYKEQVY